MYNRLGLHFFQTLQHAPQVSDAILKGDFLILAWVGTLKQFPHIYLWFFFFRFLLLPGSQIKGGLLARRTEEAQNKMTESYCLLDKQNNIKILT